MKKMLVVTKNESLNHIIEEVIDSIQHMKIEVDYKKDFAEMQHYDKAIVDVSSIDDFQEFDENMSYLKGNMVVITELSDKKLISNLLLNSYRMHDRKAPHTSLLTKLFEAEVTRNINLENQVKPEYNKAQKYGFISPSGGSGKSSVLINTAIAMAKKEKKVLVVDFSTIGNLELSLGIRNNNNGLGHTLNVLDKIDKIDIQRLETVISENIMKFKGRKYTMDILFGASPLQMESTQSIEIEKILCAVENMFYDYIFVDTSSELSEKNLAVLELVDRIMLVAAADVTSGWKIIQFKEMLDYLQVGYKCNLIVNKYNPKQSFSCRELENQLTYELISVLPYDKEVVYYANQCIPIGQTKNKKFNRCICALANHIEPIFKKSEQRVLKVFN